jgi:hypothetical protein
MINVEILNKSKGKAVFSLNKPKQTLRNIQAKTVNARIQENWSAHFSWISLSCFWEDEI